MYSGKRKKHVFNYVLDKVENVGNNLKCVLQVWNNSIADKPIILHSNPCSIPSTLYVSLSSAGVIPEGRDRDNP